MSQPFLGQITMFGGNFAPRGWASCDGQLLPISQYTALFSILGTTYGGDGRTTFGLPELRGRVPLHTGNGPGLTPRSLGQKSGTETNTLNSNNLPLHNHPINLPVSGNTPDSDDPSGSYLTTQPDDHYASAKTSGEFYGNGDATGNNTTSNTPVNNLQPFQVIRFIIAMEGTFPSRN